MANSITKVEVSKLTKLSSAEVEETLSDYILSAESSLFESASATKSDFSANNHKSFNNNNEGGKLKENVIEQLRRILRDLQGLPPLISHTNLYSKENSHTNKNSDNNKNSNNNNNNNNRTNNNKHIKFNEDIENDQNISSDSEDNLSNTNFEIITPDNNNESNNDNNNKNSTPNDDQVEFLNDDSSDSGEDIPQAQVLEKDDEKIKLLNPMDGLISNKSPNKSPNKSSNKSPNKRSNKSPNKSLSYDTPTKKNSNSLKPELNSDKKKRKKIKSTKA